MLTPARITLLAALVVAGVACSPALTPLETPSPEPAPAAIFTASGTATPTPASPAAATAARPSFPAESHMAQIVQRGRIVVGVKYDAPPFSYWNPATGNVEGFDIDIGKEIVKALFGADARFDGPGANVEWVEAISRNRISFLLEDKADLIISGMTVNDDRKQQVDFSDVYYMAGQGLLVKRGSAVNGVADTGGKTVCSAQDSVSEQTIRNKQPQARLLLFGNYSECLAALGDGRADAISTDDAILMGMARNDPNLVMVGGLFTEEPYRIGIRKGRPEFVKFVNATLLAMKKDGRWKAIYQANLGKLTSLSPAPPK